MTVVKDDERKIQITLPDVVTADVWRRFQVAKEATGLSTSKDTGGILVAQYAGALQMIQGGEFTDADGNVHDIVKLGMEVPGYVMAWVGFKAQIALNESLAIPKFS